MKPPKSRKAELGSNATGGEKPHAETAESAEFKMTELGAIPNDWEVKRLGEIGEPLMCKRILKSQTFDVGDVPFYKIGTFGGIADAYISRSLYESFRRKYPYPKTGDVLLSAAGTIGRTVVYDGKDAYFQDSNIVWVDNDEKKVLNDYLYWWYKVILWNTEDGGIVTRLYNGNLKASLIAVPPLAEQRRIAGALSDVDELIFALGKLIEKKRNIKTGAMQELLGMRNGECGMRNVPRRRLPGFSGEWIEKRLGECGSFSKGAGISRAQANSGRIPAVRYGELYTTHHEYIKAFESFISDDVARCSTRLTRGDIVFACSGETKEEIGKCAAFLGDEIAYAGGDLLILSPKEAYDSKFLAFELNTPFCASQKAAAGQGDAVVHIRQHSLEELIVCIPPTLAEQKAIATVLSDMDAEIAALEADRTKYERIKSGMMQELLTGKTRIGGFAARGEAQDATAGIGSDL